MKILTCSYLNNRNIRIELRAISILKRNRSLADMSTFFRLFLFLPSEKGRQKRKTEHKELTKIKPTLKTSGKIEEKKSLLLSVRLRGCEGAWI